MPSTMSVFISYSHQQSTWVRDRLVPVLQAGGVEVLIDHKRFEAGRAVVGQMDETQDAADRQILVFSPAYLASPMCRHEMERALQRDPDFGAGCIIPMVREDCELPEGIKRPDPLYVNLRDDTQPDPWDLLLRACEANLGSSAPEWLRARDHIVRALKRGHSVNLVTQPGTAWRALLEHVRTEHVPHGEVDLESPGTASRRGFIQMLLEACGVQVPVPKEPGEDLVTLHNELRDRAPAVVALKHFHYVQHRPHYGPDLFAALRNMVSDRRKLILVVQSHERKFAELMPHDHLLSRLVLEIVELKARP